MPTFGWRVGVGGNWCLGRRREIVGYGKRGNEIEEKRERRRVRWRASRTIFRSDWRETNWQRERRKGKMEREDKYS